MESKLHTDVFGNKRWHNSKEELHREDGPAVIWSDGTKWWYRNGKIHCVDGPAVIWPDGSKFWYRNGLRHRTGGPAVIYKNGDKEYWIHGIKQESTTKNIIPNKPSIKEIILEPIIYKRYIEFD